MTPTAIRNCVCKTIDMITGTKITNRILLPTNNVKLSSLSNRMETAGDYIIPCIIIDALLTTRNDVAKTTIRDR